MLGTDEKDALSTAPEPSGENGSAVRCERCQADVPAGDQCVACGAFLPRNAAALKHGLRRYETRGVLPPDLRQSVDEFRDGLISDQGGLSELSTIRAGLCRLLVDAEVGRRLLMNEVIRQGIASRSGRSAYDRLLSTMDKWQRIAGALGTERRLKPTQTLEQFVAETLARRAQQAAPHAGQAAIDAPGEEQAGDGGGSV